MFLYGLGGEVCSNSVAIKNEILCQSNDIVSDLQKLHNHHHDHPIQTQSILDVTYLVNI